MFSEHSVLEVAMSSDQDWAVLDENFLRACSRCLREYIWKYASLTSQVSKLWNAWTFWGFVPRPHAPRTALLGRLIRGPSLQPPLQTTAVPVVATATCLCLAYCLAVSGSDRQTDQKQWTRPALQSPLRWLLGCDIVNSTIQWTHRFKRWRVVVASGLVSDVMVG